MRRSEAEFNQAGELVGATLTQVPARYHLYVKDRELYTWCALDRLFLPAMIDQEATVILSCPVTGVRIELMVAPGGIDSLHPQEAVVSIPIPGLAGDCNTCDGSCG
ncbi:MAG: hypothetical protein JSV66_00205 [Trueperaceae bacterium]|nr:MAG: hypothetical protein JSV66_00205 [Trueperaceae bacterium]